MTASNSNSLTTRDITVNHVIIVCWETSQKDEFESAVNLLNLYADPRNRSILLVKRRVLDIVNQLTASCSTLMVVYHKTAQHKINFNFRNLLQKNWPISWKDMDHVSTFSQVDDGAKPHFNHGQSKRPQKDAVKILLLTKNSQIVRESEFD